MAVRFGLLSTYPPTACGIATFNQALATHLVAAGAQVSVVRIVDSPQPPEPLVSHQLVTGSPGFAQGAARALDACDVAVVQHEYGIFGGVDGADVLDVVAEVHVPLVVVLHTILADPTPHQHEIVAELLAAATMAVSMTEAGRQRLIAGWGADPARVTVIAHGAHDSRIATAAPDLPADPAHRTVLTWGLIGEGKGIEWALEAVAALSDLAPHVTYRIVGQTHPRVIEREGEAYRDRLTAQVRQLGIDAMVEFDDRYLDRPSLQRIIAAADVVLLPYDSRDQVTSGVLTEAVVAGKPVVSTPFPHAVELLSDGAGLLVARRDPEAVATALRRVLTEPGLAPSMAAAARSLAPSLLWSSVARSYIALGTSLLGPQVPALRHHGRLLRPRTTSAA